MTSLRLLTWNVDGLNETRLGQRMERLCLAMLVGTDLRAALEGASTPPMPEVIALQEVVRIAHRGVLGPHLSAAGFSLWPREPPEDREYYELLAVRPPWRFERQQVLRFTTSPLARRAIVAQLRHHDAESGLTVATAHLESLRSGAEARLDQVRQMAAWLGAGPGVFAGDTNLREQEWRRVAPEVPLRDAFEEAGSPAVAKTTWRPSGGGRGARFDRVWLTQGLALDELRTRRCPGGSDHDGLEVRLLAPPLSRAP